MELTHGSETSAYYTLTPGKYPKENIQCVWCSWLITYCSGMWQRAGNMKFNTQNKKWIVVSRWGTYPGCCSLGEGWASTLAKTWLRTTLALTVTRLAQCVEFIVSYYQYTRRARTQAFGNRSLARTFSGPACRTSGQEVCCVRFEVMYVNVDRMWKIWS